MPQNLNPFSIFTVEEINSVINNMPKLYGEFSRSGIFKPDPLLSHIVMIDEEAGALRVAESRAMGSVGQGVDSNKRKTRYFEVPHFPFDTKVNPHDVTNLRKTGTNQRQRVAAYLADKLKRHKQRHDITIEYMMAGALKGLVLDGSGRILIDLWSEFGVSQEVFSLASAGNDTAKFKKLFRDIARASSDALGADTKTHIEMPVSRTLFDAIVDHPVVQKHYLNNVHAPEYLKGDKEHKGIVIEGVHVWEYEAEVSLVNGTRAHLIEEGEGIAFPAGTHDLFKLHHAPSDFNEDAGKLGQQYYVKIEKGHMNRGYEIHSQFNSLPVCTKPKTLIKITA